MAAPQAPDGDDRRTSASHVHGMVPNTLNESLFLTLGTSHISNTQPRDVSQTFDRHLNFSAYHNSTVDRYGSSKAWADAAAERLTRCPPRRWRYMLRSRPALSVQVRYYT